MNQAFKIANKHASDSGQRNKKYYDKKIRNVEINVGDRVLVRNHEKGGTGKLKCYWENTIYVVKAKDAEIPVFTIRPESGKGREGRVHRNIIMGCNSILPLEKENNNKSKKYNREIKKDDASREGYASPDNSDSDDSVIVIRKSDNFEKEEEEEILPVVHDGKESDIAPELEMEEVLVESEEEEENANETQESESEDEDVGEQSRRPQRQRRQPRVFTYDTIGNPTVTHRR